MVIAAAVFAFQVGSALYSSKRLYNLSQKDEKLSTSEKIEAVLHVTGLGLGVAGVAVKSLAAGTSAASSTLNGATTVVGGTINAGKGGTVIINGAKVVIQSKTVIDATKTTITGGQILIQEGAKISGKLVTNGLVTRIAAASTSKLAPLLSTAAPVGQAALNGVCVILPQEAREALHAPNPHPDQDAPVAPDQRLPDIAADVDNWQAAYQHLPAQYEDNGTQHTTLDNAVFGDYYWQETASSPRLPIRYPVIVPRGAGQNPGYMEYSVAYLIIRKSGKNPLTQEAMTVQDLELDVEGLDRIEAEMKRLNLQ